MVVGEIRAENKQIIASFLEGYQRFGQIIGGFDLRFPHEDWNQLEIPQGHLQKRQHDLQGVLIQAMRGRMVPQKTLRGL